MGASNQTTRMDGPSPPRFLLLLFFVVMFQNEGGESGLHDFSRPVPTGLGLSDCLTITSLFTTFSYATNRLDLVPTFSLKFNETIIS